MRRVRRGHLVELAGQSGVTQPLPVAADDLLALVVGDQLEGVQLGHVDHGPCCPVICVVSVLSMAKAKRRLSDEQYEAELFRLQAERFDRGEEEGEEEDDEL